MTTTAALPEPEYVDLDGAAVATYRLQPDVGEPAGDVVFCHGTPWSSRVWAEAARHIGRTHRVLLWDMPGYGRSVKGPSVPVDLKHQMSRFARLLDHWGLDAPLVAAHDIGGAVALGAHLLHGRDYEGLFLWDIVTLEPWGSPFFRLVGANEEVFSQLPAALHAALVREYIAGAARRPLTGEWLDVLAAPWLGADGQNAFYRQIGQLRPEHTVPVSESLGRVRCPVRIGWGEDDPWIPVGQASQLRRLIPGEPPVTVLKDAGHLTPVEQPAEVNRTLQGWLGRN